MKDLRAVSLFPHITSYKDHACVQTLPGHFWPAECCGILNLPKTESIPVVIEVYRM